MTVSDPYAAWTQWQHNYRVWHIQFIKARLLGSECFEGHSRAKRRKKRNTLRKAKEKRMTNVFLGANRRVSPKHRGLVEALLACKMARVWGPLILLNLIFLGSYLCCPSYIASGKAGQANEDYPHLTLLCHLAISPFTSQAQGHLWRERSVPLLAALQLQQQKPPRVLFKMWIQKIIKHWANQQENPQHQPLALVRAELKYNSCESREGGLEDILRFVNTRNRQSRLCH